MSVLAFAAPPASRGAEIGRDLTLDLRLDLTLGMMTLGPDGLSEQWLLRLCGDQHWAMIARAMGQDSAVFADAEGRAIYAAFCATDLRLNRPATPLLGRAAGLHSALFGLGASQIGSRHVLTQAGEVLGQVLMISTFVGHDESGSNHRILRRQPRPMAALPPAPAELAELGQTARLQARALRDPVPSRVPLLQVTPCPALEFNAVGLLYFPAFSRLAEQAEWALHGVSAALRRREVIYLGNLNPGETLDLHPAGAGLDIARQDGKIIARLRSQRHPRPA